GPGQAPVRGPLEHDLRAVAPLEEGPRDVHVPVTGAARVVDRDPLFVGNAGVPWTAEFVARGVVAGENNRCEVVRCPEVRVPSEDEPTREFCRRRSEREPRQVDSAVAVRGDHGIASVFPSRVVHGRCLACTESGVSASSTKAMAPIRNEPAIQFIIDPPRTIPPGIGATVYSVTETAGIGRERWVRPGTVTYRSISNIEAP